VDTQLAPTILHGCDDLDVAHKMRFLNRNFCYFCFWGKLLQVKTMKSLMTLAPILLTQL